MTELPAELPEPGRAAETPASLPAWPGGAEVAVALTFDVDAEAPWLGEGPEYASRLTMLSQARYGPVRGLGRILDMLAAAGLRATFYVRGWTRLASWPSWSRAWPRWAGTACARLATGPRAGS